jgi:4-aminobutyrate aminotransferase/(S)-3-amino-2-methylpropionate transaminase
MLMVADEIQSGFGRKGSLFAVEHFGIVADLLVTGKSIASGMSLAAITGPVEIMTPPVGHGRHVQQQFPGLRSGTLDH